MIDPFRRLLTLFLGAWIFLAPASAQDKTEQSAPQAAEESATPPVVLKGYPSAPECMAAFLEGMGRFSFARSDANFQAVLRSLDVPAEGWDPQRVQAHATALYESLNRTALVDVEDIAQGLAWARWRAEPEQLPSVVVEVNFESIEGGAWVIDTATLEDAPALFERLKHLREVGDFLETLPYLDQLKRRMQASMPAWMMNEAFVLENWQWVGLLLLVLIGVLLDRIVCFLMSRIARRMAKSERLELDAESMTNFERPFGLFMIAAVFTGLLPVLGIEPGVHTILDVAASFVLTVAGIWAAFRLVDVACDYLRAKARLSANTFDDMLVPLARRTLKILVGVVGLVFIASRLSNEIWGIMAGLSIGSLAVGFAAKDSIENLFGTFTVLMDKPFQLGDWIVFGDVEGTVEEVGFRSTRVRTFYNSLITVPNSKFISADVDNMGARRYRRIRSMLALTYDTPPEKIDAFCEGVRQIIRKHPYTRKDYYFVQFNALGVSSLDVLLYCFLECPGWDIELREKHRLFNDILRLAARLKVSFAFPTHTVHMAKPEDLEHPDRPEDWVAGEKLGREAADAITADSLAPFGDKRPGKVHMGTSPPLPSGIE